MNIILFVISLAGLFITGESLSCYNCHQNQPPGCDIPINNTSATITCSEETPPVCLKITRLYSNGTSKIYSRGCGKKISYQERKLFVDELADTNGAYLEKSINYYCDTDLCNSASKSYSFISTISVSIFSILKIFH